MPAGIEIRDYGGTVIFTTTDYMVRVFGDYTITTGSAATGTIVSNESRFSEGTPFYYALPLEHTTWQAYEVVLTIASNNLTWSWPTSNRFETYVIWGVYSG